MHSFGPFYIVQKVYGTNGGVTAEKTGLGVMLKVMQGDTVRMSVESFYTLPGGGNVGAPLVMGVMDLIGAFTTATGFPVSKGLTSTHINAISGNPTNLNNYINNRTTPVTQARAALNWILFDDQFHYVSGGFELVDNNGGYKLHNQFINNPVTASKNGFLYIYVSNESNLQVFFDNLLLSHTNGPIQEETHYYPFGLTMAGISTKALNGTSENNYKYNGKEEQRKEFSDGTGLDWYDYGARMYDYQIGRWNHIDPMSEKWNSFSPFNFTLNSPINYVDPDGRDVILLTWATANGSNGHTAIGIENYREVEKRDKKGNVVYDRKGNVKTEMVSTGTFTLYELGPEGSSKMVKGDDAQKDSQPFYHAVGTFIEAELKNNKSGGNNISAYDEYAPDGVIRVKTDYAGDTKATAAMNKLVKDNQPFNPASNNCSVFGVCAINAATGQNVGGTETIKAKGQKATTVTPNALFRSVRNLPSANVLVDPGAKINNRFIQGKYPILYPLIED